MAIIGPRLLLFAQLVLNTALVQVDYPAPPGCDLVAGMAGNIKQICQDISDGTAGSVIGSQDNGPFYTVFVAYANCGVDPSAGPYDQ